MLVAVVAAAVAAVVAGDKMRDEDLVGRLLRLWSSAACLRSVRVVMSAVDREMDNRAKRAGSIGDG